jgi:hypothetical protein
MSAHFHRGHKHWRSAMNLLILLVFVPSAIASEPRLTSRVLDVRLDPKTGSLTVTDKRIRRAWRQVPFKDAVPVASARRGEGGALIVSVAGPGARVSLSKDAPEIEVALSGQGKLDQNLAYPLPFSSPAGAWLVVPLNEGILYPVEDATIAPRQLVAYGGHGISMPWYGLVDPKSGAGVMTILETPDDARIDITRPAVGQNLTVRPLWEASRGEFSYPRKLRYVFFDRGGYVAMAKRYRLYARKTGLFKSLAEKRRENPNVDLLIGAVNVWNWDMDKVALAREMKAAGMDWVLWSSGGEPEQIAEINKLGFLTSHYDIFQDVYPPDSPPNRTREG